MPCKFALWSPLSRLLVDSDVLRVPFAIANDDDEALSIPSYLHVAKKPSKHPRFGLSATPVFYVDFAFHVFSLRFCNAPGAMQA